MEIICYHQYLTVPTKKIINKRLGLSLADSFFRSAVESAFNHIVITDPDGKIVFANKAVERITGYSQKEIMSQTPRLWGGHEKPEVYKKFWHTIKVEKKVFEGEFHNQRKNGEIYIAHAVVTPILDEKGEILGFIGTEEDVTKAKEVDRMKSEFISIAAHQLKTPVTGLAWTVENMKEDLVDVPKAQPYIVTIKNETDIIDGLIDLLLNISRIESGRLMVEPISLSLSDLVNRTVREVNLRLTEKDQRIVFIDEQLANISLDPKLMREIVINLLTNAIKYSPENSQILVNLTHDQNNVCISVQDSGVGIPKSEQHKIFEKFFRASNANQTHQDGTGLGLYFVRLMVQAQGGSISFVSQENKGSTFSVLLPLSGAKKISGEVSINESQA